ncbi:MAG: TonB-dependent receptor, partial [Luminiphilus sp.]
WVVGGNFLNSTQEIDRAVMSDGTFGQPGVVQALLGLPTIWAYSPDDLALINGAFGTSLTPGIPGVTMWNQVNTISYWEQETESWALFAQGTFN